MQRVILEIGGNFVSKTELKLSNMVLNIRTCIQSKQLFVVRNILKQKSLVFVIPIKHLQEENSRFCCSKHLEAESSRFLVPNI